MAQSGVATSEQNVERRERGAAHAARERLLLASETCIASARARPFVREPETSLGGARRGVQSQQLTQPFFLCLQLINTNNHTLVSSSGAEDRRSYGSSSVDESRRATSSR